MMKTKNTLSTATIFIVILFASTNANATGAKVKPPVEGTPISMSWYQPVLDFFNI